MTAADPPQTDATPPPSLRDGRCGSGAASAASASAGRPPTSRCCASCASSASDGSTRGEFEDAIAACNLLPGPASTQLAIFCAWRVRGRVGALVGGARVHRPRPDRSSSRWPRCSSRHATAAGCSAAGAGRRRRGRRGRGARRARSASRPSWRRAPQAGQAGDGSLLPRRRRAWRRRPSGRGSCSSCSAAALVELDRPRAAAPTAAAPPVPLLAWRRPRSAPACCSSVAWVAFKVGALSYGGGFVIIPLMQADAVDRYHWMTDAQFLNAVALGQITPGPVVQTVAVVGYARRRLAGGLLAAAVAFSPSFAFVLLGAHRFDRLRARRAASGRSSTAPGPPRSARSSAPPSPSPPRSAEAVAVRRPRRRAVLLLPCAAASCRPCSPPPRSASSSPSPADRSPTSPSWTVFLALPLHLGIATLQPRRRRPTVAGQHVCCVHATCPTLVSQDILTVIVGPGTCGCRQGRPEAWSAAGGVRSDCSDEAVVDDHAAAWLSWWTHAMQPCRPTARAP